MNERQWPRIVLTLSIFLTLVIVAFAAVLGTGNDRSGTSVDNGPIATTVSAFEPATGALRWQHTYRSPNGPTAELVGEYAFVLRDRALFALDVATGTQRWHRDLGPHDFLRIGPHAVYVANRGELVALDLGTGARRWSSPEKVDRVLSADDQIVAVAAYGSIDLIVLDAATGALRWRTSSARGVESALVTDSRVLVRDIQGTVTAFDRITGDVRWHFDHPKAPSSRVSLIAQGPMFDAGGTVGVLIVDTERTGKNDIFPATSTVFLDLASGEERWRTLSGFESSFALNRDLGLVFEYGQGGGELLARDALFGTVRWRRPVADSKVASAGSIVFAVPTAFRFTHIVALDAQTGDPRWTKRFHGSGLATAGASDTTLLTGA